MKSRIGIVLASIFLVITVVLDVYAFTCNQTYCWLIAIFTAMPWIEFSLLSPNNVLNPFIFQIFNAIIIYFIGCLITNAIIRFKK